MYVYIQEHICNVQPQSYNLISAVCTHYYADAYAHVYLSRKTRRDNDKIGVIENPDSNAQDVNLELYSQKAVDRFAVLFDLWNNEAQFQEVKMRVCPTNQGYLIYSHITEVSFKVYFPTVGGQLLLGVLSSCLQ